MPKLSIIVPVYNTEKYLEKCIKSILAQTYTDYELILVNDGSTDKSGEICDLFASDKIHVIHKENGGAASARRVGVNIAKGEYIGFIDADDWIDPNMYSSMLEKAYKYQADIVISGIVYEYDEYSCAVKNGFPDGFYDKDGISSKIIPKMICGDTYFIWKILPSLVIKMFKREKLIGCLENFNENIVVGEDAGILYPYITRCDSLYVLNKIFYHYRVGNNDSVSCKYDTTIWKKNKLLYEYLIKNCDKKSKQQIEWYYVYLTEKAIFKELFFSNKPLLRQIKAIKSNLLEFNKLSVFEQKNQNISFKKSVLLFLMRHKLIFPIYLYHRLFNQKRLERKG